MLYIIWALPALIVIGLLASGRATTLVVATAKLRRFELLAMPPNAPPMPPNAGWFPDRGQALVLTSSAGLPSRESLARTSEVSHLAAGPGGLATL